MMSEPDGDLRVMACNFAEGIAECSEGALCYVLLPNPGGGYDRIMLLARSRSGRWIEKWEAIHRLTRFRLKTVPPEHPLHVRLRPYAWPENFTPTIGTPAADALQCAADTVRIERLIRARSAAVA